MWHKASTASARVEVVSSWQGWKRPGTVIEASRTDGWRVTRLSPPPGPQSYAIVDDGVWVTDPTVGTSAFHDGHEVSFVEVADCSHPLVRVDDAMGSPDGHAVVRATFLASTSGRALDGPSVAVTEARGAALASVRVETEAALGAITISVSGLSPGKHALVLNAKDSAGGVADNARATVWIEPRPWDWRDARIYQVMVDRFGSESGPLLRPANPAGFAGGTIAGVKKAVEDGRIAALGFDTLWLSPLYDNAKGAFPSDDGHSYSAYHGYWPAQSRAIDPRFGTEGDLDALVTAAHARGLRVLFDVVPHHVHEQHPYVTSHLDGSWFTDWGGNCVCGTASCSWETHIGDCWFASYLPTLDWTRDDVAEQATADVAWWLARFDGDGVRIDAVPMMPRAATRRIAARLRATYDHPGNRTWVLGENFTAPEGYDSLRYHLGPDGLDSEFHFPLMWALRGAVATESEPLSAIDLAVRTGEAAWAGSGAVMATMIGNHDVTRFASEADGTASGDGWQPAPQPTSARVYQKQRLALGALYTLPGTPVVYQGDELGLAGRRDPDSRRVLPSEAALSDEMRATRDFVAKLGGLRGCSTALRRGAYRSLDAEGEALVFARESDDGSRAVVVMQRSGLLPVQTALPSAFAGAWVDALSGAPFTLDPTNTSLAASPWSIHVLLPQGDACLRNP